MPGGPIGDVGISRIDFELLSEHGEPLAMPAEAIQRKGPDSPVARIQGVDLVGAFRQFKVSDRVPV